jgi:hypothetical protein
MVTASSPLKIFLTVAAERSFSRAAVKLYRTQPAVSQAISRLERELGERLFDRRTGVLTTAGRLLQQRGGALVRMVEETETAICELHEPAKRVVTIGANEAAVHALLPVIAAFRNRRQDVEIDVPNAGATHRRGGARRRTRFRCDYVATGRGGLAKHRHRGRRLGGAHEVGSAAFLRHLNPQCLDLGRDIEHKLFNRSTDSRSSSTFFAGSGGG